VQIAGAPSDGETFFEQWPIPGYNQVTISAANVFAVAPGTHTFELWATVAELDAVVNAGSVVMTATTYPFQGGE
jgi:hypothetical protein